MEDFGSVAARNYKQKGAHRMNLTKSLSEIVPLEQRVELKDNARVLDVGCRYGLGLDGLKGLGLLRVGVDLYLEGIKKGHLSSRKNNLVFADACFLPFKDRTFSLVMSRQFVSHVWNVDHAFAEMKRVCSGTIYVEDSNALNPVVFLQLVLRIGLAWTWQKGRFNRLSKLEDIHSIFYWKRKFRNRIKIESRRDFHNSFLNLLWEHFGPDCIFTIQANAL